MNEPTFHSTPKLVKNHISHKEEALERIGDYSLYREIANLFANHLPLYAEQLQNALDANELPTIKRVAHSIKSSCATIGAEELRNIFAYIEQQAANGNRENVHKSLPQALKNLSELRHNINEA